MSLVLIVPNEPLPRSGKSSSGPGLRALNLASGLQSNGHDIMVAIPAVAHRSPDETAALGPSLFLNIEQIPIDFNNIAGFIRTRRPDAVIFTNYINFDYIIDKPGVRLGKTKIIYDFFAPRILELISGGQLKGSKLEEERQKKMRALRRADAILLNGNKKLGYVAAWLALSGANLDVPIVPTPFCVPVSPRPPVSNKAGLTLVLSGNRHAWTRNRLEVVDLLPIVAKFGWKLAHIGTPKFDLLDTSTTGYLPSIPPNLLSFHANLDFITFLRQLHEADLALDVFETSREREMAYATRTAVAMSAGLPIIHPEGTETADLISKWKCGWTYKHEHEILGILDWIYSNPDIFRARAAAAAALAATYLNPRHSTAAASQLISELTSPVSQRKAQVIRIHSASTDTMEWFAQLTSAEWLQRRYNIDHFDAARAASAEDLYLGVVDKYRHPPPNFVFEYAMQRFRIANMRDVSIETGVAMLTRYFDVEWYGATYGVRIDIHSCATHYFSSTQKEQVSPNPFFCERLYRRLNPEVDDAITNRLFVNGFHHFLVDGMRAKLTASILFDEEFYLRTHRDVLAAVENGHFNSGFEHFIEYGRRERRQSSAIFDPTFYRNEYPDLERDWDAEQLRGHFLWYGLKDGRHGSQFHRDLLTKPLQEPPFGQFANRARGALITLGVDHVSAPNLAHYFEKHIIHIQSSFERDLSMNVDWLRRLRFFKF